MNDKKNRKNLQEKVFTKKLTSKGMFMALRPVYVKTRITSRRLEPINDVGRNTRTNNHTNTQTHTLCIEDYDQGRLFNKRDR